MHFRRLFLWSALLGAAVAALAPHARADSGSTPNPLTYTLMVTDRLRISVYQEDDLSSIVRIDAKGTVNLPLVGEVKVAGLNVEQAQNAIEAAYRDGRFLRNPQVTISIEEYAPREVAIEGQVRNPGRYPLPIESTMTIVDLVTRAGGLTDTARGTAVIVTRITPDGKKTTYTVDVESMIKGKADASVKDNAIQLQPGDIVYVPERII